MCNGCKGKYDKSTQTLCIQHEVWRTFTPHGSTEKQTHSGNVYYIIVTLPVFVHFWPTFEHTTVVAPIEVQARMLPNISILFLGISGPNQHKKITTPFRFKRNLVHTFLALRY